MDLALRSTLQREKKIEGKGVPIRSKINTVSLEETFWKLIVVQSMGIIYDWVSESDVLNQVKIRVRLIGLPIRRDPVPLTMPLSSRPIPSTSNSPRCNII